MTAPAEHGDTPDLTEQERHALWSSLRVGFEEAIPVSSDAILEIDRTVARIKADAYAAGLSARSAATPDTAAEVLTDAECEAIVRASIDPDRVFNGRTDHGGFPADVLLTTVERILANHLSARPAPGPDAATALPDRWVMGDVVERVWDGTEFTRGTHDWPADADDLVADSVCKGNYRIVRADRLAAASPAPKPATEDTETLARVRALLDDPDDTQWWPVVPYMDPPNEEELVEVQVIDLARLRDALDPGTRDQADQPDGHDIPGRCGDPTCDEEHP